MKYLSHLALPLLMFVLLALAFVLPKFVQNAAPEEGSIFSPSTTTKTVAPVKIKPPSKILAPVVIPDNSLSDVIGVEETNYDNLIPPFISLLKDGKFGRADQMLNLLEDAIPEAVHSSLEYSLGTAKGAAKQQKAYEERLAEAHKQVAEAKLAIKDVLESSNSRSNATVDSVVTEVTPRLPKLSTLDDSPAVSSLPRVRLSVPSEMVEKKSINFPSNHSAEKIEIPTDMSVKFGFNSTDVPYYFFTSLDKIAELLKNEPGLGVELRGYSDSVGNAHYNKILSENRSNQIRKTLVDRGVSSSQIVVKTFGASVSPSGRSANHRRVDVVFYER